ncbi:exosortase C-terminal domain/associated protein EpsI [Psychromonas sp. KJ10-2]|uniref:exosortase C-terminal domain/associated protein EpsI n=1 Tax=Psychromonas sp. KJ10-2 TaxID=3391822 RepID=UPI0039B4A69E
MQPETSDESSLNKKQASITLIVLITFVVASYWIPSRYDENYAFVEPSLDNYQLVSRDKPYSPSWKPYSQGATQERFSYYIDKSLGFQVYLADYYKQEQASEMIFVENYLFDEDFWTEIAEKKLAVPDSSSLSQANLVVLKRSAHRYRLVASWYVINETVTSDKKMAKLAEVKAALIGKPGATLVAVSFDFDGENQAMAEQQLSEFIDTYLNSNQS